MKKQAVQGMYVKTNYEKKERKGKFKGGELHLYLSVER